MRGPDNERPGSVEVSAFDLGRLFARMDSLDARLIEVRRDTAVSLEKLEQRIETRMGQFAESLAKLADGYVRREDLAALKREVDGVAVAGREQAARLGALEVQGGRAEPLMRVLWEVVRYSVIAGLGVAGGRFLGH
jgi:hypothetical protein